ncbi:MAG: hypothetical protein GXO60_01150, partial [Epsilonproteobacteria bacterium]|nr:hypothetical protein [Campylobacterota bacterium]
VEDDDFGYDGCTIEWNMMSMSFTDTEVTFQEIDLPDNEVYTLPYIIDENGSIVITYEEDGETQHSTIAPIDTNGTVIRVDNDRDRGYIFSSEEEARAFRDAKNAESTMSGFTIDFLNGKTLYYVAKSDFGHDNLPYEWNMAKASFTDTEITWQELVDGGDSKTFPYAIEDGSIVVTWTDGDESGTFGFKLISSNSRAIHVLDIMDGEIESSDDGYFFFDEEYARAYMNRQNGVEEED